MVCGDKMERYEQLKQLLREGKYFKLVCGAGNEDIEEVKKLATIYTLGGANVLDLSANVDVVKAANEGVELAYELAPALGKEIKIKPYLNVSIGLKGDPHVRKALIDLEQCTSCGECRTVCPQDAIPEIFVVKAYKCIGCGKCEVVCEFEAIGYYHKKADFDKILPECIDAVVETMELHAVTEDDEATMAYWKLLNELIPDNFLSMCLDRSLLSNKHLMERVRQAYEISGERLIIQADGVPMGGEGDDYNTTLQAIACADIVRKGDVPVMILLSGGTNSKTGVLAKQCGVNVNGIAIGSWARKVVKEFVARDDLYSNMEKLSKAVSVAEELVNVNMEAISG
ncbi:MAG: hypothetical protein A2W05_00065 [Candidatus Schekmanbacteria bacterium RBG_16_38_10]|uniref:4Fe-4S ferredoxin-type domain-containing protein n=1 Tax=Candidatus Schekmanbacteria bacterium RBG_16_38_10 TaxID=1817879 RepID=A0A1F7S1K2_9BACT|nr:MAG: hypothetical protein A2W05_00065 [Candidatus Schekmanbacteria bacterium RBG_16_38_10]